MDFSVEVAAALSNRPMEVGVGAAAELAQLSSVDWNKRLDEERQRQHRLLAERSDHQINLQRLDSELGQMS